jgi:hypothetical protein
VSSALEVKLQLAWGGRHTHPHDSATEVGAAVRRLAALVDVLSECRQ